jgi:hypothetical protein
MLLVAFSRVSYSPSEEWMQAHEVATLRQLQGGQMGAPALTKLLHAYRTLRYRPRALLAGARGMQARRAMRLGRVDEEALALEAD